MFFVFYFHSRRGFLCALKSICHHQRHELTVVINLIVFKRWPALARAAALFKTIWRSEEFLRISVVQHRENPRHFFSFAGIDVDDLSCTNGAANSDAPRHIVESILNAVSCRTGYLQGAVDTRNIFSDDFRISPHAKPLYALVTICNARTTVRFASSILNALSRCGLAPRSAASAARRNTGIVASLPAS